ARDHQMNTRGTWVQTSAGLQAAPAPRFSKGMDEGTKWSPPESPTRGQHTAEILRDLEDLRR
ncbi:MAG: CoA transferase, partial [Phaeobacter italicus]